MPRLGLISDTHGYLDPQGLTHFAGVDHIVHAGDVGRPSVVLELEAVAPVTVVSGNVDSHPDWLDTEVLSLAGRTLLVHHIVRPHRPHPDLLRIMNRVRPDVVVFGHTHERFSEVVAGILYVNPGAAGDWRPGQTRSVAVLSWEDGAGDLRVEFMDLKPPVPGIA